MCDLYNRLLSFCNQKGVTGAKMCRDCDLSKSLMSDLKYGRRDTISSETAVKIANYFNVTVAEVLTGEKEKAHTLSGEDLTDEQIELVKLFRGADSAYQAAALALLREAEAAHKVRDDESKG